LLTLTSCFNLFSLLAPTDPAEVDDVTRLIAIGQQSLNELDYQTAYDAFSKAFSIAPTNSIAIEGMCTAYVFLNFQITNVIGSIVSGAYSNLGFNTAFQVGAFLSEYLYLFVDGKADGVIPQDDFSVNINFFMFNTLYAAFFIADTDNDLNVQMDTNDYFLISNDLSFTAVLPDVTNNFIQTLKLINAMRNKVNGFVNLIEKSEDSLLLLSNSIHSTEAMTYLLEIESTLFSIKDMIALQLRAGVQPDGDRPVRFIRSEHDHEPALPERRDQLCGLYQPDVPGGYNEHERHGIDGDELLSGSDEL
jgi:hypothetical protein